MSMFRAVTIAPALLSALACTKASAPKQSDDVVVAPPSASAPAVADAPLSPELALSLEAIAPSASSSKLGAAVHRIAESGHGLARKQAGERLVLVAEHVATPAWSETKRPLLEQANANANTVATQEQFNAQLARYQSEEHGRVVALMDELGGAAIVTYCLAVATSESNSQRLRQAALLVLEHYAPHAPELARLRASIKAQPADAQPGAAGNAGTVVAAMAKDFRRCWNTELAAPNPPSEARGRLSLKLDAQGAVIATAVSGIDRPAFAKCLEAIGKAAKFEPPESGTATIIVPIVFSPPPPVP